jgi:hypothetical protein
MSTKVYQLHGKNYLVFDEESGRITAVYDNDNKIGDDCFLMPIEAYYGLTDELFRIFGTDSWLILQKAGEGAGRVSAKSFQNTDLNEIATAIRIGFNGFSRWGFGMYKLKELDIKNKHMVFELHRPIFEYHGDNSQYKKFVEEQHFLLGFYTGFFSSLFGNKMRCLCSRINDDAKTYYKFEVNPAFEEPDNMLHSSTDKRTANPQSEPRI